MTLQSAPDNDRHKMYISISSSQNTLETFLANAPRLASK